jgi:diacylglycerol kinase family enzyme
VDVLREVTRFKHVGKGLLPYLLGLISALKKFHSFRAELTLDTGELLNEAFTIVSIANGRFFGGGMKVAPLAEVTDGLLDVMIIRGLPKFAVPFLLPLFITGLHAKIPAICRVRRCRRVKLVCPGMTFNMDGELHQMDEADIQILPGHLAIHLPSASFKASVRKTA